MTALLGVLENLTEEVHRGRYSWANEYELQDGLEVALNRTGREVHREHHVTGPRQARYRLDFYVDRCAIEVKIKGSTTDVTRQLGRYAKCDDVDGILLVTTVAHHTRVPREIFGKPVVVVPLFGGLL